MTPDIVPDGPGEDTPNEILWDKARTAVASLESSADTTPRWIAALLGLIFALLLLVGGLVLSHIDAVRTQQILDAIQHGNAVQVRAAVARATLLQTGHDQQWMRLLSDLCVVLAIAFGAVSLFLIQGERGRNRLRELHLEFTHTQRLALMGQTSVAIAHEVNQPLTAASNYLAVLKNISAGGAQLPPERAREIVPKIELQIRRAGDIVQRLRNFLAIRDGERVSETPKTLIADAVELLGTLDVGIKLETHVELGLPAVLVDRVQIQQVLVNLMRNALEAMQDKPQRRLVLKAAATPGRKVTISIEDNGPGLSEQIAKNLFKPFVSSKRSGMGVGLSICQVIVTAHGGRIWADSSPSGTAFHFTLPAARDA